MSIYSSIGIHVIVQYFLVRVDALHPSQQFFSHVGTIFIPTGLNHH